MRASARRLRPAWLVAALAMGPGCARDQGDALVVATSWSEAERAEIEAGFRAESTGTATRIAWVRREPGEDEAGVVGRPAVDVLLGGSTSTYRRLADGGKLDAAEGSGRVPWRVARRSTLGLAIATGSPVTPPADWAGLGDPALRGRIA